MRNPRLVIALAMIAGAAAGQDPVRALPNAYRVVFENETMRVIRVTYGPHEKLQVHDHPRTPTVYVYLNDSPPVRFSHLEEKNPFTVTRAPVSTGWFRVSPGRLETHEVENTGDTPSDFLRVELKSLPLGFGRREYRRRGPVDLSRSGVFAEYANERIRIERIVADAAGVDAERPRGASLLVALSPALVNGREMKKDDVRWMAPEARLTIGAPEGQNAHVLRLAME